MRNRHKGQFTCLLVLGCCAAIGGANAAELSGTPHELKGYLRSEVQTVTIRKSAEETAYSDIAKITLSLVTKSKQMADAINANDELRRSITQQLGAAGIGADSIRSSKYSASPQYGWFGDKPASFQIVNTMVITIDEQSEFQRVAEIADEYDSVQFAGVKFEHSEKEAFEQEVKDQALDKVLAEQRYFEEKLGLQLSAVTFEFADVRPREYDGYQAIEEIIVTGTKRGSSGVSSGYSMPAPAPTFDEVRYEASVAVTFEVAQPQ